MSKILFLFLFIFINCETYEGAKVFEIANSKGKKYEVSLSVEVGEELLLNSLEILQLDILGYY